MGTDEAINKALSTARKERENLAGINTYDISERALTALDRYERGEISGRDLEAVHKMLNFVGKMIVVHLSHVRMQGEKPGSLIKSFSILDSRKEIAEAIEESVK